MFCSSCGSKLNDGAKFCAQCGTKVAASQMPQTESTSVNESIEKTVDDVKETVEDAKETVEDAKETVEDAKETATSTQETLKEAVEEAKETVVEEVIETVVPTQSVASTIEEAQKETEKLINQINEHNEAVNQNPLKNQVTQSEAVVVEKVQNNTQQTVQQQVPTQNNQQTVQQQVPTQNTQQNVSVTPVTTQTPVAPVVTNTVAAPTPEATVNNEKSKKAKKKHAAWPCYLFSPIIGLLILAVAICITVLFGIKKLTSDETVDKVVSEIELEDMPANVIFSDASDDDSLVDYVIELADKKYHIDDKKSAKKIITEILGKNSTQKALSGQLSDTLNKIKKGKGNLEVDTDAIMKILESNSDVISEELNYNIENDFDEIRENIDNYNKSAINVKKMYKENKIDTSIVTNIFSETTVFLLLAIGGLLLLFLLLIDIHYLKVAFMNIAIYGIIYCGIVFFAAFNGLDLIKENIPKIDGVDFLINNLGTVLTDYFKSCGFIGLIVTAVSIVLWVIFAIVAKIVKKRA